MVQLSYPLGKWSGVFVYDNAIPDDVCDKIVNTATYNWDYLVENNIFKQGLTVGGYMPAVKSSWDAHISKDMDEKFYNLGDGWAEDELHSYLTKVVNDYVNRFANLDRQVYPLRDTGYQVQRYFVGYGKYDEHIDGGPFGSSYDRFLAVIVYLNDVCDGGQTTFPHHDLSIDAKKGRVLVFPATWLYPHRGEISFDTDKWILTTFITSSSIA